MFLSKLSLDIHHGSVRQALKNRQDMHRNLSQVCSGKYLYRITHNSRQAEPVVLLLSDSQPSKDALTQRGFSLIDSVDLSPLQSRYREGTSLHFNLLTSPSKKKPEADQKNSRRIFLNSPELREEWFKRQSQKYGFCVLQMQEASSETISVQKKSGSFFLTAVELTGIIQIVDASRFWAAWEQGFGPEKAYGMGLMLLSR